MSRSGYNDDFDDHWAMIRYRGAVESAANGSRGQAFFREMLEAMDSLPEPKLISHDIVRYNGPDAPMQACAIGAVAIKRNINVVGLDPEDPDSVAHTFGIAPALAREIVYMNDEWELYKEEDPAVRFSRMRRWVKTMIRGPILKEDEIGRWADDGGAV